MEAVLFQQPGRWLRPVPVPWAGSPNPVPWAAVEGRGTATCGVAAGLDLSPSTHTLNGGDHHQCPVPSLLAVVVEPRQLRKGTV